ncbi:small ribosomal subunit protein mS25 isoform X1 [Peromyscus maniculatus bairdii]|uniref:Small ribosomal subunit protein mS25 n=1 Tax=Peromyscus maniculatus bairdii TaxID=230844 RepID=A0A6I9L3V3_PERMB|nr:28S ribosomal protein S25, mitochondrial isoform X1 [Peromyscus maniculatus bairdii]XP_028710880.1 28S ribosomal protein S25, mitochondrial isoform X3 [Peromyscus leucopus]XP_052575236.1 28S ribosomal protein S25, mitochondrial [Peromyscus californicus insignis]XP_059114217.1 small ribosomal subunit protein mS25 [Peromyscus eremicus]
MPMKGRFPIRRTLQYLGRGDVVFKESVKVMTVNYNTQGELGEGARKFVFFNIPQIQYKNPWVQIMLFKNMTPSPFLRFYLDSGEQVLVDVETKSNKEIMEHIKKILGKKEETLREEELEKQRQSHPANFGPRKYCLRECMCEVEGQVPCPGLVPLPKEMTGKYKAALKAST